MIRVFVFVTGIALAQFSGRDNATVWVVTGYTDIAEFQQHVTEHNASIEQGSPREQIQPDTSMGPVVLELTAPCAGPCPAIAAPPRIADLDRLLDGNVTVKPGCRDDPGRTVDALRGSLRDGCWITWQGMRKPLVNTLVRFKGSWKVDATIDCYGPYPSPRDVLLSTNFLRPNNAWDPLFPAAQQVGNSMVFYTDIQDDPSHTTLNALLRINGGSSSDLEIIHPSADNGLCARLGGIGAPDECVVLTIRNKSENSLYHGGGDPHFAGLYALLLLDGSPIRLEKAPLPISLEAPVCPGGGGCCFLAGCVGGRMP